LDEHRKRTLSFAEPPDPTPNKPVSARLLSGFDRNEQLTADALELLANGQLEPF
jgi:hypothetical protein